MRKNRRFSGVALKCGTADRGTCRPPEPHRNREISRLLHRSLGKREISLFLCGSAGSGGLPFLTLVLPDFQKCGRDA